MTKILPILIGAMIWAYYTQTTTIGKYGVEKRQSPLNRFLFFMLVLTLALPIMLRKFYNDTTSYIHSFQQAQTLVELLESGELHILKNPLFYVYESLVRTFTDNYMIFFLFPAFFVQYSYLRFIRKHSSNFVIGVGLYLLLGAYMFSIAAMKQTIAMAILLYAVDLLIQRKYTAFYALVFLAFLFHTYAIAFVILPLFTVKPWTGRAFLLLLAVYIVMQNFDSVLQSFLDFANESGKNVATEEVIGAAAINPIRVAVYAVTPLLAFFLRGYLFEDEKDREHNILVNMSIITVAIMSIGLISAANMFARMGQYFEFGIICSLPWMLKKAFDKQSARFVGAVAIVCFVGYFCYANLVQIYFDDHYGRHTVLEFIQSLFAG